MAPHLSKTSGAAGPLKPLSTSTRERYISFIDVKFWDRPVRDRLFYELIERPCVGR